MADQKPDPGTRQIQARVPAALVERLDQLAAARSTSLRPLTRSDVMRDLLVEAVLKAEGVAS